MILFGWAGCSWEGSGDRHPREPGLGGISLRGCRQPPHTAHGTHFSCACWGVPPFRFPVLSREGGGGALVSAFPPPPDPVQVPSTESSPADAATGQCFTLRSDLQSSFGNNTKDPEYSSPTYSHTYINTLLLLF